MGFVVRDYVATDLTSALRLLEECRAQPDTKPVDIAHFVSDVSSGSPVVVAVAGDAVAGLISARIGNDDAWVHIVAIAPAWRHRGLGSSMLACLEERLLHLGVRKISALPDAGARSALWNAVVSQLHTGAIDVADLVDRSDGYTPGDIGLAAERAAGEAFDRARSGVEPGCVTQADLFDAVSRTRPSVSRAMAAEFRRDVEQYERV